MNKWWIISLLSAVAVTGIGIGFAMSGHRNFDLKHIISHQPHHQLWEVEAPSEKRLELKEKILNQPFVFLGEGGQSYAFVSADGHYVLKFFKFQRFLPSPYFALLPAFGPFKTMNSKHVLRREKKMRTAFNGYRLAYEKLRDHSGLLWVQLNKSHEDKMVVLIDNKGLRHPVALGRVPYILQKKGDMLNHAFVKLLDKQDLPGIYRLIDQVFDFFQLESTMGIRDIDRGIMHNLGLTSNGRVFHLDPGKLVEDHAIKAPKETLKVINQAASKISLWFKRHFPTYSENVDMHINDRLADYQSLLSNPKN